MHPPPGRWEQPWSFSEFLDTAKALTKRDRSGRVSQWGYVDSWVASYAAGVFGMNNGVPWSTPRMNPTHLNFDNDAFLEGIQFYADLANKHKVAPTASETQSMSTMDLFISGRAAMALGGHWRYQTVDRAEGLDFDITVLPTGPKGRAGRSNIGTTGLAIAASSRRKQQAWEFVKFATGPVGQAVIGESRLFVPVLRSAIESAGFAEAHRRIGNLAVLTGGPAHSEGMPVTPEWPKIASLDGPQHRPCSAWSAAGDIVGERTVTRGRRGTPQPMTAIDESAAAVTRRRRFSKRRARAGRMFVAPNLAAVAVFMLFPLGFSLYMSLQNWDLFRPAKFVGLANYRGLFTGDPLFVIALRNTVVYTVGTVVPTVLDQPRRGRCAQPESQGNQLSFGQSYFCPWLCHR